MEQILDHDRCALFVGEAGALDLPENSIDSIVFDPPAGISFMAKGWDDDKGGRDEWIAWLAAQLGPSFRALKPGGHALGWAIPRTSHWTALALELAGFEIRDIHHHLFGTGFPKSLTSKSAPIPEWAGTALKPAVEHWILARKPLGGTVGDVFARYGTGVMDIGACRIGGDAGRWPAHLSLEHAPGCRLVGASVERRATYANAGEQHRDGDEGTNFAMGKQIEVGEIENVLPVYQCALGCPVHLLDEQSGVVGSNGGDIADGKGSVGYKGDSRKKGRPLAKSKGGASRFFFVAKAPRSEKDAGLEHLPKKTGGEATGREDGSAGTQNPRAGAGRTGGARNFHPTVKSIALMEWLLKLITPCGGTVLDPFAGSGTTGVAALGLGLNFIGCELGGDDGEYVPVLVGRIRHALGLPPVADGWICRGCGAKRHSAPAQCACGYHP